MGFKSHETSPMSTMLKSRVKIHNGQTRDTEYKEVERDILSRYLEKREIQEDREEKGRQKKAI